MITRRLRTPFTPLETLRSMRLSMSLLMSLCIGLAAIAAGGLSPSVRAQAADGLAAQILPLRERAALQDEILRERLDSLVPQLMRREGISAWVIIGREYNEDPVLKTMLPATWLNARRRTVLLFIDRGSAGIERMAVARYAVGDLFPGVWDPERQPDQYARIAEILAAADPDTVAVNTSNAYALADGLTYSEQRDFAAALPATLRSRLVSAERLAVGWLETRTPRELALYEDVMAIAHGIIAEGFSRRAITPGVTTTEDLEWWYRQRVNDLGLTTWFHNSIEIERPRRESERLQAQGLALDIIQPGDHVHIDFGISYLNLQTDTQQNAYILRPGETDAPAHLRRAFAEGNALQDILTSNFETGLTGNEILSRSRAQALESGLGPIIYTHPIGLHGHAAGTTIGMWDRQDGVPGSGDYPLHADTAYSIELTAEVDLDEWGEEPMKMKLEQNGYFDGARFHYFQSRQTQYHLIGSDAD